MERKYVNTVYGKLSYLIRDGNYPVIFLHGFGGTGNTWLRLEPYLRKDIMPVFIDLLGHGHSDKPDIEYRIDQQCKSVMDLASELKIKNLSLVGNSYGGWISLKLSSNYINPDNLFLIDSAGISPALSNESKEKMDEVISSILKVRNYKNKDALYKIMENNSRDSEKITDEELKRIKSKTYIIWGKDDKTIDIEYGTILNQKIKSEFIQIDNAGHTPFISYPEKIAEIINKAVKP